MPEYDLVLRDGTPLEVRLEGLPADPESCFLLQQVQGLDSRDLREIVDDLPDRDGDFLGGVRQAGVNVIVDLVIVGATRADLRTRERALKAALRPTSETWLMRLDGRVGDPEPLIAEVRTSQPLRAPHNVGEGVRALKATFALRGRDAVLYGIAQHLAAVTPVVETQGFAFPVIFPVSFEGSVGSGTAVAVGGDSETMPVLRLYGPMAGVRVENLTTDQALVFPGAIDAGTFLQVESATKTITLGGDPAAGRYSALDRATSSWWPLAPGVNLIRLRAASWSGAARAEITWRDAYQ